MYQETCKVHRETNSRAPNPLLPKLHSDIFLREPSRLGLEHLYPLLMAHLDLVADGHHAPCEVVIVLAKEVDGDHDVVDIGEHQRMLGCVFVFGLEECGGVLAPVTEGVQVVGRVVSVVEAVSVTLCDELVERRTGTYAKSDSRVRRSA